jgi:amidase
MDDPIGASVSELAAAIREGETTSEAVVEAHLDQIRDHEELNAFVTVIAEEARERAREADAAVEADEELGPLHGVPVAIKDLEQRKQGVRNTMGVSALADNVASDDSITVERLEAAGAVILGTTNLPALGHTIKTDNRLVGATPTPFDHDYSAGGSSGGSAAALATGMAALATGSDIGGSLRVPASCCHVASIKPTLGRVPLNTGGDQFGHHTPSMVLGPLARSVEDLALAYDVLAGIDHRDPFSVHSEPVRQELDRPAEAFDVAFSPDLALQPVEAEVRETVGEAVDDLAGAGATVDEVDPDLPAHSDLSSTYITQVGVFFAAMANQLEDAYGIDFETADVEPTVPGTIALGEGTPALADRRENLTRTAAYQGIEAVLAEYDALVTPTLAVPNYSKSVADEFPTEIDGQQVGGFPTDAMLTWVFNVTGHPVVNVPAGFSDDGLPIGMQIVGQRYDEATLLSLAAAYEGARPWADAYPV